MKTMTTKTFYYFECVMKDCSATYNIDKDKIKVDPKKSGYICEFHSIILNILAKAAPSMPYKGINIVLPSESINCWGTRFRPTRCY